MTRVKYLVATALALSLASSTAYAVTVTSKDAKNQTIGVDWGNKEAVEQLPAGKSATFDCPSGCGVTGPWGFSWMATPTGSATWDGKTIVPGSSS